MTTIRPLYAAALALLLSGFGLVALRAAPAVPGAARGGPPQAPAASEGKALFEGACGGCHGMDGSGGTGPSIRQAAANLGPDGVLSVLKTGVMGTGMPTFGQLGDAKLLLIVDYVGSLGREGSGVVAGNPEKGKEVYNSNGCSKCHIVGGEGGNLGPDLSRIGAQRGLTALRDAVVKPGANLPLDVALAERGQYMAHLMYRAVTKDGREVTGMRVNEDSFTIQLRDANGRLHSLRKLGLQKLEVLPGKSLMPGYKETLSDTQISDLVGYLGSLRGAQ